MGHRPPTGGISPFYVVPGPVSPKRRPDAGNSKAGSGAVRGVRNKGMAEAALSTALERFVRCPPSRRPRSFGVAGFSAAQVFQALHRVRGVKAALIRVRPRPDLGSLRKAAAVTRRRSGALVVLAVEGHPGWRAMLGNLFDVADAVVVCGPRSQLLALGVKILVDRSSLQQAPASGRQLAHPPAVASAVIPRAAPPATTTPVPTRVRMQTDPSPKHQRVAKNQAAKADAPPGGSTTASTRQGHTKNQNRCGNRNGALTCEAKPGHTGPHVAATGKGRVAVWPSTPNPSTQPAAAKPPRARPDAPNAATQKKKGRGALAEPREEKGKTPSTESQGSTGKRTSACPHGSSPSLCLACDVIAKEKSRKAEVNAKKARSDEKRARKGHPSSRGSKSSPRTREIEAELSLFARRPGGPIVLSGGLPSLGKRR
jgi:hypothetical protein